MIAIKQSSTAVPLMFFMVDSTDKTTPKTGLTPTVTISKNGASFATPAGTVSEVGSGWYKVAGNATDTNTLGSICLQATGTGADAISKEGWNVVAYDPYDAVRLGLSAIPNASAGANGGLPTGNGSGQVAVATIATDAVNAAALAANAVAEIQSGLSTLTAADVWNALTSGLTTNGSIGKLLAAMLDAAGIRAAIGLASANLDTQLSAIGNKTTNLPPDPADASDIAALFTALGALVTAIKQKTDNLPASPAATGDIPSANISAIKQVTDWLATMLTASGSNKTFTTDALKNAPASGGGSGLDPETVGKLNAANQILLAELWTPNGGSNLIIPDAPSEESLCRVYGYVTKADGTLAAGVKVTFTLKTAGAAKGARIIASRVINVTTDSEGRISDGTNGYIDLIRTDSITPSGAKWEINGPDLKIAGKQVDLAQATFDIATVVS